MGESGKVRVDVWAWSARLYKTRSAAASACRAGHVRVAGERAKPSTPVRVGDEIRARTDAGERVVVVRELLTKRVGAPLAAEAYEDRTPPPPPRLAAAAPVALRERGTGRPTKRERRALDALRGRDRDRDRDAP